MRRWFLLTLTLFSFRAFGEGAPTVFIHESPLSPTEVAELKERLKRTTALSDTEIERMVKDESTYHTYRESDIVAAFPELRGDRKLSACSNRMMLDATEIVYLSDIRENEVTVKSIHCDRAGKGLSCGPIFREKNYFLDSPAHFFALDNLTLPTARTIIEAYKAGRIDTVPDWFVARPEVRSIKALPDGRFRLWFGEHYCSGCTTVFNVRLETKESESRLVYAGDADGGCY
jgi:hypothetical protein